VPPARATTRRTSRSQSQEHGTHRSLGQLRLVPIRNEAGRLSRGYIASDGLPVDPGLAAIVVGLLVTPRRTPLGTSSTSPALGRRRFPKGPQVVPSSPENPVTLRGLMDGDRVAQLRQPSDATPRNRLAIEPIEVIGAQVLVDSAVLEHVIDDYQ